MNLYQLKWSQVSPKRYKFDQDSALPTAIDAIKGISIDSKYRSIEDEIDRQFIEKYGDWAAGWRFSRGEGSLDGGVVTAWCCTAHSVLCYSPQEMV